MNRNSQLLYITGFSKTVYQSGFQLSKFNSATSWCHWYERPVD